MPNEDIAALGERISQLERVVTTLCERADLAIPDLLGAPAHPTGFASDRAPSGFAGDSAGEGFASVGAERDPEVLDLITRDEIIRAIKRYRELTECGLAEAKEAVERIAATQRSLG